MRALPELLLNDEDDDGESLKEALNQIEKFRQIIKNKYLFKAYICGKFKDKSVFINEKFKCSKVEYHKKTGKIKYMLFEQITS